MLKTYDPKLVIATFGNIIIDGWDEDSFLTAEREEDTFTKKVGASGEVVRSRSRNRSGTVTFRLLQSSSANTRLTSLHIIDEQFGTGVGPLRITDLNGETVLQAENAWIQKPATVEFAKEAGSREWVIACAELEMYVGGSTLF